MMRSETQDSKVIIMHVFVGLFRYTINCKGDVCDFLLTFLHRTSSQKVTTLQEKASFQMEQVVVFRVNSFLEESKIMLSFPS